MNACVCLCSCLLLVAPPRVDLDGEPLPEHAVARLGSLHGRHQGGVTSVVVAPDSKTAASGGADGFVRFWEVATGKELRRFRFAPEGPTWVDRILDNGKLLACRTGWPDNTVRLLETATGKEVYRRGGSLKAGYSCLALSPDGKRLAGWSHPGEIHVWETLTGKEVQRWKATRQIVLALAFTPDAKTLLAVEEPGEVVQWTLPDGEKARRTPLCKFRNSAQGRELRCASFSPDARFVTEGRYLSGTTVVWDVAKKQEVHRLTAEKEGSIQATAFSTDGKLIAATGNRGNVNIWEAEGTRVSSASGPIPRVAQPEITALAFSEDGKQVLSGGTDGTVRLWTAPAANEIRHFGRDDGPVTTLTYNREGTLLATGTDTGVIGLWETRSGKRLHRISTDPVAGLAFSGDGKTLAVTGWDGPISLCDVAKGQSRSRIKAVSASALTFLPDSRTLAVNRTLTPTVQLVDITLGKVSGNIDIEHRAVDLVAVPDGGSLIVLESDGSLTRRDVDTGAVILRYEGRARGEVRLRLSRDGRMLVGREENGDIGIWETISGKVRVRVSAKEATCLSAALANDGRTLAIGSAEHNVSFRDLPTGKRLSFHPHRDQVNAVAFSPDGKHLAAGGRDTTVLIWDIAAIVPKRPARALKPAELPTLWDALAGEDAMAAYVAMGTLMDAGADAVALLAERLPRVALPDDASLRKLIAELDGKEFRTRERAQAALLRAGLDTMPALRKALVADPTPEARRRIEDLLRELAGKPPGPDTVTVCRGVEVLEKIGTAEAKRALAELAKGSGVLAREARAALARLP